MRQILNLAERGRGYTRSNPLVGAVILDSEGWEAGWGYHERLGAPHAEVAALSAAGERARGGTLILNLEPCCHTGRTGPCTRAVLEAGVKRVVVAHRDPDPRVNGRGLAELQAAGVEVIEGVEADAAKRLNEHYLTFKTLGRAFVTLKLALSLDGRTTDRDGRSQWITGPACRRHAHALRAAHDAIVVGAETARRDNPKLTVREVDGPSPRRFVLVGQEPLDSRLHLFAGSPPALRVGGSDAASDWQVDVDPAGYPSPLAFVRRLASEGYAGLLVEGGARVAGSFMRAGLVDKVVLYYGPVLLGDGAPTLGGWDATLTDVRPLQRVSIEALADGFVITGYTER